MTVERFTSPCVKVQYISDWNVIRQMQCYSQRIVFWLSIGHAKQPQMPEESSVLSKIMQRSIKHSSYSLQKDLISFSPLLIAIVNSYLSQQSSIALCCVVSGIYLAIHGHIMF